MKKLLSILALVIFTGYNTIYAQVESKPNMPGYFNGPTISNIKSTSALLSLSNAVLSGLENQTGLNNVYFEYYKTNQVCIAIFPTPAECLPKTTQRGATSVLITDLTPNTSYTVVYKKDNTIRCITTPCPTNEFTSESAEFTTLNEGGASTVILMFQRNIGFGSQGKNVIKLQNLLIGRGFMQGNATGYFGAITKSALKKLQRSYNINSTGYLGPQTRIAIGNGN